MMLVSFEVLGIGGKSGAPLYFSKGKKLVIKIVDDSEFIFLKSFAEEYGRHMLQNPNSLILRVGGLYQALQLSV